MTTCEEIKELVRNKELENTKYELKSSKLIGISFFLNNNL